ncbi:MAG: flagellar biosynthesis anti-sigma factor FlgM [Desulfotomaculales bacterium]
MKVTNNSGGFVFGRISEIYLQRPEKNGSKENLSLSKKTGSDAVEISGRARELQFYKASLREIPEVRKELVENIKNDIARGTYEIDAGEIAKQIIAEIRLDRRV